MNKAASTVQTPRDKSPQPLRSPSPDYAARSAIFSTKSLSSAEIVQIAGLTPPKQQRIPLLEEIADLRKENKELQERLQARPGAAGGALMRTHSQGADTRDYVASLLEQLRIKDIEISELKSAGQSNLPTFVPVDDRMSPAKRMNLMKSESQQIRDMNDHMKRLADQNEELRKSLRESNPQPQQQSSVMVVQQEQLSRRIRELERNNEDLKAEVSRVQKMDVSREGKQMLDLLRSGDQSDEIARLTAQIQRIKMEHERNLQEFKIKISHRLHEMEQRILDLSKRESMIVGMIATQKKEARISEGGKSSLYSRQAYEPSPIFIDQGRRQDKYSTPNRQQPAGRLESTAPVKTSEGGYQSDQLNQQLLQQQNANSRLRRQLQVKAADYERLSAFTDHLKNEVDNLNRQLIKTTPKQSGSSEGSQYSNRIEQENEQLRAQINTINSFADQLKREKLLLDEDIKANTDTIVELRNTIIDLRNQLSREVGRSESSRREQLLRQPAREPIRDLGFSGRPSLSFSEDDYSQLQSDNRTLRQTLEALRTSHTQLLAQLERMRKDQLAQPPQFGSATAPSQPYQAGQWFESKPSSYYPTTYPPAYPPATTSDYQPTTAFTSTQQQPTSTDKPPAYVPSSYLPPTTTVPEPPRPPVDLKQPTPSYPTSFPTSFPTSTYPSPATLPATTPAPPPVEFTEKNIELQQLRAEVNRLKANNELLQREKNELARTPPADIGIKRAASDLSDAADELTRERQRSTLRDRDYQNLKLSFERVNSEMMQIPLLKEQASKEKADAQRYKRIAEQNSLDLNILRKEKQTLQGQLRDYVEVKKRSQETDSLLRLRDEEIVRLRRPYRSMEFDTILQELQVIKQELERIKLEEIPKDTAALVENIRQLLTEKTSILKSVRKNQSESASLTREIARLKKECLDLNSKYTTEREENQRIKAQLEAVKMENSTYQREISRLKDLITGYTTQVDTEQLLTETITSTEQRQWQSSEQQSIRISKSYQASIGHELDSIRSCCQYARLKLQNISEKIVQELAKPREPAH